jgi:hypothetical protein
MGVQLGDRQVSENMIGRFFAQVFASEVEENAHDSENTRTRSIVVRRGC